jgi:hypothetical protein
VAFEVDSGLGWQDPAGTLQEIVGKLNKVADIKSQ